MSAEVNGSHFSWYFVGFVLTLCFYIGISYWKVEVLEGRIEELSDVKEDIAVLKEKTKDL